MAERETIEQEAKMKGEVGGDVGESDFLPGVGARETKC